MGNMLRLNSLPANASNLSHFTKTQNEDAH